MQFNDTCISSKYLCKLPSYINLAESSWTSIIESCIQGSILPTMLLFERCDTKEEKEEANESLDIELEYLVSVLYPQEPKSVLQNHKEFVASEIEM